MFVNTLDRTFENLVQTDGYFLGCLQDFWLPGHLQEMVPLTIHVGLLCKAQSDACAHTHLCTHTHIHTEACHCSSLPNTGYNFSNEEGTRVTKQQE